MDLSPFSVPMDAAEVRVALRRVRLSAGAACRGVFPTEALPELPDDVPGGSVRTWWASLTTELLGGGYGEVWLIQDGQRGLLGGPAQQTSPATVENVLAAVALEVDVPSSAGIFTLAWGITESGKGMDCQGAAFSMADHLGLCLCASVQALGRLQQWWAV